MPKPKPKPNKQTNWRNTGNTGVAAVGLKPWNNSKNPPEKAYLIVHDGEHVLVGTGGRSGKHRSERKGYHLPGGTIDPGENAEKAALRELREETGIDPDPLQVEKNDIKIAAARNVTFVVARAADVNALVASFKRPDVDDHNDEPFSGLVSLPSANSWLDDNFNAKFWTDWFKHGLFAAQNYLIS
jgi:8-oxo-dGTP pyrophosphatase MutT (NUDIX family)